MRAVAGGDDFFSACARATTVHEIEALLFEAARRAGFPYVSYLCGVGSPARRILLTNYPDAWQSHYRAMRYDRLDPIIALARNALDPFTWNNPLTRARMAPRQLRILEEARGFRLGDGFVAPLHASFTVPALCVFAAEHGDLDPGPCADMHRNSVIAHEFIARLTRAAEMDAAQSPWPKPLSERERTCLEAFARGDGDDVIAATLGLKVATVRRHFELARRRLGVRTRKEAMVRALLARQIESFGRPSSEI